MNAIIDKTIITQEDGVVNGQEIKIPVWFKGRSIYEAIDKAEEGDKRQTSSVAENFFFQILCLPNDPKEKSERYAYLMEVARKEGIAEEVETSFRKWSTHFGEDFDRLYWERPKSLFEERKLSEFPLHALPDEARKYVEAVASLKQVAPDMVAAGLLGMFAAAAQKKYAVQYGLEHSEPLSLYIAVGADPAERKTAVMSALREPFVEYENTHEVDNADGKPTRLFSSGDVTPEMLADLMSQNDDKIAILTEEGGIFEILDGRYSNGVPNLELFKQAYDGAQVTIDRKTTGSTKLKRPAITKVVYCQPLVIQKLAENPIFREQGFSGRFMFVLPPKYAGSGKRELEVMWSPAQVEEYHRLSRRYAETITKLLNMRLPAYPLMFHCSEEARAYARKKFRDYDALFGVGAKLESRSDWMGKHFGRVMRVAAILALIETLLAGTDNRIISLETLKKAFEIGEYLIEHAIAAFGIIGKNVTANRVEKALEFIRKRVKKDHKVVLKKRDIHRDFKGSVTTRELDELLELVESLDCIRLFEDRPITGRPSVKIYVNPLL